MADLETLRPEVKEALDWFVARRHFGTNGDGHLKTIRTELLRLSDENETLERVASKHVLRCTELQAILDTVLPKECAASERAEKAEAELAESRETIKRLNRRVQVAEAGVAEKVKASGGSLGRALANAAADRYMRERDEAQAELAALKARIVDGWLCGVSNDACPGNFDAAIYCLPSRFRGRRVRLLVEE